MKKIIVLGMLLVIYPVHMVSCEENPVFTLLSIGIACAGLKFGTEWLQQNVQNSSKVVPKISLQPRQDIQLSSLNVTQSDAPVQDCIVSESISAQEDIDQTTNNVVSSMRGLLAAKRHEIHIPHIDSPNSTTDISTNSSFVLGMVATKIPFSSFSDTKKEVKPTPLIIRPLSPDDYQHISTPPKKLVEDGYIMVNAIKK